jgi:predicted phosphoadenosine phosphosulfate sulfurtransferase
LDGRPSSGRVALKLYYHENVFEAAQKRVARVFDEFDEIVCSCSGGKDSTVILELALAEAERRGRLPLKVFYIDQESEWQATIDYIEGLTERPEIDLYWIQLPFYCDFGASFIKDEMIAWEPGVKWIRPKSPKAIVENVFGDYSNKAERKDEFYRMFDRIISSITHGKPFANIYGIRADENPHRRLAMMRVKGKYKNIAWCTGQGAVKNGYKFGPIYDWDADDVWTAIFKEGWEYNEVYNKIYQWGRAINKIRVSSLTHGIASSADLRLVQEIEPQTYEALLERLPGIGTYSILGEDIVVSKLPAVFSTWKEYLEYLLETICSDEAAARFRKMFAGKVAQTIPDGEDKWRDLAQIVMVNDILGVRLANIAGARALKERKEERRGRY